MHPVLGTLPLAVNYIDWLPLTELFVALKIMLIPAAVVMAIVSRLRGRRGDPQVDESHAGNDAPSPMWANRTLEDVPAEPRDR